MRSESSFEFDGDLITVEATISGLTGHAIVQLVLDTGSALTTLSPEVAEAVGYTSANRVARTIVRSAVAEEPGYIVRLSQFTALGFALPNVHANVADLSHEVQGLLGMNFLSEFNIEIRPGERRILAERITL